MPTRYPSDRFDTLPDELARVGAHRAPRPRGRRWVGFAWAALATGVLVGAGILALTAFSESLNLPFSDPVADGSSEPAPSDTVPATTAPVIDPTVSITVVNAAGTDGLAASVGDGLVAQGWCGATGPTAPADGSCAEQVGSGVRLTAAETVESTVVYYDAAEREAAARALVESLGVGTVALSDAYPDAPITVVVGSDYPGTAG